MTLVKVLISDMCIVRFILPYFCVGYRDNLAFQVLMDRKGRWDNRVSLASQVNTQYIISVCNRQ